MSPSPFPNEQLPLTISSTGVISSTLVSLHADLARPLSTLDKSLITSATSFFALLVSPVTGLLADRLGRWWVILVADVLFVVGAGMQAAASSVPGMVAGRCVVGLAVGSASFVVPLYIAELAPGAFRGRLVTVYSLFVTGGQVVAYVVGWGFAESDGGWRWMVGLGAVPAVVQGVLLCGMPETPRFLVKRGRVAEGRRVLDRVYGGGEGVERLVTAVLRGVEKEVLEEEEEAGSVAKNDGSWTSKLAHVNATFAQLVNVGANRRALIIACMLQAFQQLCGFNSLMYFSATIFRLVGFHSPTLTSLSIAITNFLFTLIAFWIIDRVGRRRILLYSVPLMAAGLALCALAFAFIDLGQEHASRTENSTWPLTILAAMLLYVAAYAIGLGCVPWQQSELFPLRVRALGSALATSTNWASNTVVGLSFLPMMEVCTPSGTFALYAGVCAVGWGAVWRIYPETAGLGLEDVRGLLGVGWGVRESVRRFGGRGKGKGRGRGR